ncbi:hypothetical protein [Pseudonocardia broussonetiae]|uniref:Uncharacterized protein n=1 Tax=Pseudonocardia broussonetiae TaxID=2736640 RepID=A0A6M6JF97_9PSEU|nr:hypothetical protein [Pseudonocardia broussonetiae]QJY46658.1 hypothetical protein HOP40_13215 [Pseudonocardia broussonetiae]
MTGSPAPLLVVALHATVAAYARTLADPDVAEDFPRVVRVDLGVLGEEGADGQYDELAAIGIGVTGSTDRDVDQQVRRRLGGQDLTVDVGCRVQAMAEDETRASALVRAYEVLDMIPAAVAATPDLDLPSGVLTSRPWVARVALSWLEDPQLPPQAALDVTVRASAFQPRA